MFPETCSVWWRNIARIAQPAQPGIAADPADYRPCIFSNGFGDNRHFGMWYCCTVRACTWHSQRSNAVQGGQSRGPFRIRRNRLSRKLSMRRSRSWLTRSRDCRRRPEHVRRTGRCTTTRSFRPRQSGRAYAGPARVAADGDLFVQVHARIPRVYGELQYFQLLHNDFVPANVLMLGTRVTGVLDFEFTSV